MVSMKNRKCLVFGECDTNHRKREKTIVQEPEIISVYSRPELAVSSQMIL